MDGRKIIVGGGLFVSATKYQSSISQIFMQNKQNGGVVVSKKNTRRAKRRLAYGAIMVIVLLAVVFGSWYWLRHRDKTAIKVGYLPIADCLPYFLAENKGYFANEGIKTEAVRFQSSKDMMDALLQGRIDIADSVSSGLSFITNEKSPDQFKVFGINTNGPSNPVDVLMVKSDSTITSVSQLKGKKIGSFPGIQATTLLKRYLKTQGLDPAKDVTIQEMSPDLHLQALQSGQVDAILTYEPNATVGTTEGIAKTLVADPFALAATNPYMGGVYAVSTKFINEHPTVADRFINAHDKAINYINSHEGDARTLLPKFIPIEENIAQKVPLSVDQIRGTYDKAIFQKYADVLLEEKLINTKVDVTKLFY